MLSAVASPLAMVLVADRCLLSSTFLASQSRCANWEVDGSVLLLWVVACNQLYRFLEVPCTSHFGRWIYRHCRNGWSWQDGLLYHFVSFLALKDSRHNFCSTSSKSLISTMLMKLLSCPTRRAKNVLAQNPDDDGPCVDQHEDLGDLLYNIVHNPSRHG